MCSEPCNTAHMYIGSPSWTWVSPLLLLKVLCAAGVVFGVLRLCGVISPPPILAADHRRRRKAVSLVEIVPRTPRSAPPGYGLADLYLVPRRSIAQQLQVLAGPSCGLRRKPCPTAAQTPCRVFFYDGGIDLEDAAHRAHWLPTITFGTSRSLYIHQCQLLNRNCSAANFCTVSFLALLIVCFAIDCKFADAWLPRRDRRSVPVGFLSLKNKVLRVANPYCAWHPPQNRLLRYARTFSEGPAATGSPNGWLGHGSSEVGPLPEETVKEVQDRVEHQFKDLMGIITSYQCVDGWSALMAPGTPLGP